MATRISSRSVQSALMAVALSSGLAINAQAHQPTHVIELFTSQGCSSCPPADRLIADIARDADTVAVSFPVDYWDYIGWKDTFASPLFTARQRAYALARGDGRVYTPQVVVDGLKAEVGSDKTAIVHDMDGSPEHPGAAMVPMAISETSGYLHVAIGAAVGSGSVYVLRVVRSQTVDVSRGGNSGRRLTYTNVVRAMSKIGDWMGQAAQFDMLELKGQDEGYVVLLQAGDPVRPAAILAAAKTAGL